MAGIGIRLNRIFEKNTLTTDFLGFAYSTVATVAPMLVIIINLTCMGAVLGFDKIGYAQRELFSCTMLYIFIFALLTAAPFNAVLSRYMSDVIYEERYEDIRPCYYLGMMINLIFSCLLGIPFCIREHLIGKVSVAYTFADMSVWSWCFTPCSICPSARIIRRFPGFIFWGWQKPLYVP